MKVNKQLVDKLAELAKLEFDEKSKAEIVNDLNNVLTFVEQLNEVDTTNVEPLTYITDEVNVLRKDVVKQEITKEEALKNAPLHDSDYIKVPKVIQK